MVKKKKDLNRLKERNQKNCGVVTCIHCVGNKCGLKKCDFYERVLCQEY